MTKRIIKQSGIYAIINNITGFRYIGQSCRIIERKWQHFKELKKGVHHCVYLQRSFNIHRRKSFTHEIIELCNSDIITEREQYYIDFYRKNVIYNTAQAAGSPFGIKRSDESKRKMSIARLWKKPSEETKRKMG